MDKTALQQTVRYFQQRLELNMPDYIFSEVPGKREISKISQSDHLNNSEKDQQNQVNKALYEKKRKGLITLYYKVKNCLNCELGKTRTNLVFGSGNSAASIMVIGEAPGFEEDRQGKPFVGQAGELLTKMLLAINIDRENDIFLTNILKCRPPENRDPNQVEANSCLPIIKQQIAIVAPQFILALGRIAAHTLLGKKDSISRLRTQIHTYNSIPVVVTYHPAALLRNSKYKRPTWEDLQKLQKLLDR